jgi:hypothetical protein
VRSMSCAISATIFSCEASAMSLPFLSRRLRT